MSLSQETLDSIAALFVKFDKDQSGKVNLKELYQGLDEVVGLKATKQELLNAISQAELKNSPSGTPDGEIDKDEFVHICQKFF